MKNAVLVQLWQFCTFVCLGAALGFWYDLLRPVRRGRGAAADILFALGAWAALFGVGAVAAERGLYLYMAAGAAAGFALWWWFASRTVQRAMHALGVRFAASRGARLAGRMRRGAKKYARTLFSSAAKWVTIVWKTRLHHRPKRRQTAYEAAQGKRSDPARHRGAAALRRHKAFSDAKQIGRSGAHAGGTGNAGDRA